MATEREREQARFEDGKAQRDAIKEDDEKMEALRKAAIQENLKLGRRIKTLARCVSDGPIQDGYLDKIEDLLEDVVLIHEFIHEIIREAIKMEQRDPEKVAALQRELAQNSKRLQQAQEIADTANQIYLRSRPKQGTVGNQPDEDEESDHEVGINYRPQNVNPSSVGRATHTNMGVVKKIEVPKFSGNILEYQDWKQTFQAMVGPEQKTLQPSFYI